MSRGNKIGVFIIIGILFLGVLISSDDSETVINDTDTYEKSWRKPIGAEYGKIGRAIVSNNIKTCGEYYVKETHDNEYVIACSADGKKWTYYVVWTSSQKVLLANDEMIAGLNPPR